MAINLLDTVKSGIPGSFAAMAGGFLGESGASTGAALTALLPVLMATLARSGATSGGAKGVLALLANPSVDTSLLPNLNGIFGAGGSQANSLLSAGSTLASSVFGEGLAPLTAAVGSVAGFAKPSSAQKLIALALPIALAFLKRHVGANALSADGLAALLAGQRSFLEGTLDGRLASALGYADPAAMLTTLNPSPDAGEQAGIQHRVAEAAKTSDARPAGRSGFARWLPWLVGAIFVLYALSRLMTPHEPPASPAPAMAPASTAAPTPPAAGAPPTAPAPESQAVPATNPPNNLPPSPHDTAGGQPPAAKER